MWVILSLVSAFLLGFYDIFKKQTVVGNAIIPVLFYSTLISSALFLPFILLSQFKPYIFTGDFMQKLFIEPLTARQHLLIIGKTALILCSWMFSYSAMKHLPITVVGPVNQLRPAITVILMFMVFHESLTWLQGIGVVLAIISFYFMNRSGKLEGIQFKSNKWVYMLLGSAVLVALSGVYDKFLLSKESISPATIQAWYTVYDFLMMAVLFFLIWLGYGCFCHCGRCHLPDRLETGSRRGGHHSAHPLRRAPDCVVCLRHFWFQGAEHPQQDFPAADGACRLGLFVCIK